MLRELDHIDTVAATLLMIPDIAFWEISGHFGRMVGNPSRGRDQGAGSIPILSFTAEVIRWVQPR